MKGKDIIVPNERVQISRLFGCHAEHARTKLVSDSSAVMAVCCLKEDITSPIQNLSHFRNLCSH